MWRCAYLRNAKKPSNFDEEFINKSPIKDKPRNVKCRGNSHSNVVSNISIKQYFLTLNLRNNFLFEQRSYNSTISSTKEMMVKTKNNIIIFYFSHFIFCYCQEFNWQGKPLILIQQENKKNCFSLRKKKLGRNANGK